MISIKDLLYRCKRKRDYTYEKSFKIFKPINKNDFANSDKQMLCCKECGKRFVVDRGQLTIYSHQAQSKWNELILDILKGVSLKETAAKINVNERNVFNVRHKLLVSLGTQERPIHSR